MRIHEPPIQEQRAPLPVSTAILLLQHLHASRHETHDLPLERTSSFMLGYMGRDIYLSIQAAGGLMGEW